MARISFPKITFLLALLLVGHLSGACTREDDKKPPMPQAAKTSANAVPVRKNRQTQEGDNETTSNSVDLDLKIRQWETIQETALADYDVCLENCSNAVKCMETCDQAYVLGLAAEYKILFNK